MELNNRTIYLAGAMEKSSGHGAGWRDIISDWLDQSLYTDVFTLVIPEIPQVGGVARGAWRKKIAESKVLIDQMKSNPGQQTMATMRSKDFIARIVPSDLDLIENSDIVLAFMEPGTLESHGTVSELTWAQGIKTPYYIVVPLVEDSLQAMTMWAASTFCHAQAVIFCRKDSLGNYDYDYIFSEIFLDMGGEMAPTFRDEEV